MSGQAVGHGAEGGAGWEDDAGGFWARCRRRRRRGRRRREDRRGRRGVTCGPPCASVLSVLSARSSGRRGSAAAAPTPPARPRLPCAPGCEPPCSRTARSARAVLMRSSQSSTGRPVRRAIVSASVPGGDRAGSFRPLSGERAARRRCPTGWWVAISSSSRGMGTRLPRRRTRVASGEARVWVSSLRARPMRTSPQSNARIRPVRNRHERER